MRVALALALTGAFVAQPRESPLLVSAAISLADALQEIGRACADAGGPPANFNYAASNILARQIVNGAPVDLFISADEAQMNFAESRGAIDPATRVSLLSNRLAVVVPRGAGRDRDDDRVLSRARRIAIGDPAGVPAGVYAKQYLQSIGLWDALRLRLLTLTNVRAVLAAAESGGVDAAIVYESDAAVSKRVDVALVVTGAAAPRIVYPAAITARSTKKAAAARFLEFLRSPEATRIFQRHRFSRPEAPMDPRTQDGRPPYHAPHR